MSNAVIGPDFLCVGARKAGTTWLYKYFEAHPEVYLPPVKEINFFNSQLFRDSEVSELQKQKKIEEKWQNFQQKWHNSVERNPSEDTPDTPPNLEALDANTWYLNVFSRTETMRSGDISPLYQNLDRCEIEAVHQLIPDAKIIYILRDPVKRLWSDFVMEFSKSYDLSLISSEQAFNLLMSRTVRGFSFSANISMWSKVYKENFRVFFFEDFIADAGAYVTDICTFLGLTPEADLAQTIKNPNPGRKIPLPSYVQRGLSRVVLPELEDLAELMKHPTIDKWLDTVKSDAKKPLY